MFVKILCLILPAILMFLFIRISCSVLVHVDCSTVAGFGFPNDLADPWSASHSFSRKLTIFYSLCAVTGISVFLSDRLFSIITYLAGLFFSFLFIGQFFFLSTCLRVYRHIPSDCRSSVRAALLIPVLQLLYPLILALCHGYIFLK